MCKVEDLVVMVCEPKESSLREACLSLEKLGIKRIMCVYSYEEAIEALLAENNIDIVITDYAIEEGKDLGTLLVSVIKRDYPGVVVVLTSKDYSCSVVLNSIRINADDILDTNRENDIELLVPKWIALAQMYNETRDKVYGTGKVVSEK